MSVGRVVDQRPSLPTESEQAQGAQSRAPNGVTLMAETLNPRQKAATRIPEGFVGSSAAAEILGVEESAITRRWLRRHGIPAYQFLRGGAMFFKHAELLEFVAKRSAELKLTPEKKPKPAAKTRRRKGGGNGRASAPSRS